MPPQEMTPQNPNIAYRLQIVERVQDEDHALLGTINRTVDKHDIELHGERGVNDTLRDLAQEIKWLRRALWGLASAVTVASIVFALGTLSGHA